MSVFCQELRALLEKKPFPVAYDGFEPSGRMHIAQGLLKVKNVNRLTSAGCIFVFWVADWFAMLNNKMGGDLKKASFPSTLISFARLLRWQVV